MDNDSLLRRLSAPAEQAMLADSKVKKAIEELFWIAVAKSQDNEFEGDVFHITWDFHSREVYEEWEANGSNEEERDELGSYEGSGFEGWSAFGKQVGELFKNLPAGFDWSAELEKYYDELDAETFLQAGDWYLDYSISFENQEALLNSSVFIEGVLNQASSLQTDSPIHKWMLIFVLETFTTSE